MGSKYSNIVANYIIGLGFMLSSAPPNWAVSYFPKYNIGKIIAIILLFFYTMPVLIFFSTVSFIVLIIEQIIQIIRNEKSN